MESGPEKQFWPYFNENNTEDEVIDDFLNVLLEVESIDVAEKTQHSIKTEGGDDVPDGDERASPLMMVSRSLPSGPFGLRRRG